jgi:hypothetical protein
MPLDVETAYKFLIAQPTVSPGILVAGGASCGVNQSVHLAMKHPEIKALVLLSEITDLDAIFCARIRHCYCSWPPPKTTPIPASPT